MSRKHSNKSWERSSINLEPYIQFEQERITRSRVVFHSVRFNLDRDVLQSIQYAKDTGRYALVDPENRLQSDLTFYTYYLREGVPEAVMRSVISTDGEVFHQIKSDCLESPDWYRQIASAHYWLIDQLLSQLRLGAFVKVNWLFRMLSWLVAIAVALAFVPLLIEINPWLLLALVLMAWFLQKIIYKLLRSLLPSLSGWTVRHLLSRLLSHKPLDRKIAKGFLARLEP
jgi:hypothetical protein